MGMYATEVPPGIHHAVAVDALAAIGMTGILPGLPVIGGASIPRRRAIPKAEAKAHDALKKARKLERQRRKAGRRC